jgi:two-component system sensor histidine kinase KdpD
MTVPKAIRRWVLWFAILIAVTLALFTIRERLDKAHIALAFLIVVLGGSAAEGRALGLALASVAFLAFDILFLPPYNTLVVANPLDYLVLLSFLITGVVSAQLLERQRRDAAIAVRRAEEIDRLAALGAETLNAPRAEQALEAIANVICRAMDTDACEIYLREPSGALRLSTPVVADPETNAGSGLLDFTVENSEAAAERADGTLTLLGNVLELSGDDATSVRLKDLRALGIPLTVRGRIVGALRLRAQKPFSLSADQRRVLGALSYYAALGAERVRLATAEDEAESLRRADKLKDALLAAVSHDLRTPLTAIKAIANEVWRGGDSERAQVIEIEADRLGALVDDLLQLSQLNAGGMRLRIEINAVDDLVGAALQSVEAAHGTRRIEARIDSDGDILAGRFDFSHAMRALTNLLENAIKYSPDHARITLRARRVGANIELEVGDEGVGVHPGDEDRIFEPFYRGRAIPDGVRGTGLGLSVARQLTEAQAGTLTYAPRPGGGSLFTISLPAADLPAD